MDCQSFQDIINTRFIRLAGAIGTMMVIVGSLAACNIGNLSVPTALPLPYLGAENEIEPTPMATDESPRNGPAIILPPTWTPPATQGQAPNSRPAQTRTSNNDQQTYIVQVGDTLAEIAIRFNVALDVLADTNGIVDHDHIEVGQVLIIPGG